MPLGEHHMLGVFSAPFMASREGSKPTVKPQSIFRSKYLLPFLFPRKRSLRQSLYTKLFLVSAGKFPAPGEGKGEMRQDRKENKTIGQYVNKLRYAF